MVLPRTGKQIEMALLKVIQDAGGRISSKEAPSKVAALFPEITDADLELKRESGHNLWINNVQWARQALISKGELDGSTRAVWGITGKGRERLEREKLDLQGPVLKTAARQSIVAQAMESDLYGPVRDALNKLLVDAKSVNLEITARGLTKRLQKKLDDVSYYFVESEGHYPDIMGTIEEEESSIGLGLLSKPSEVLVLAEIKNETIKIADIYQAKRYAEIFNAKYAFLISSEEIPSKIARFVKGRPGVVRYQFSNETRSIMMGSYVESSKEIQLERL